MKVLINLNSLQHPLTGIGEYTLNITRNLLSNERLDDIRGIHFHRCLNRQQIRKLVNSFDNIGQQHSMASTASKLTSSKLFDRNSKLRYVGKVLRKSAYIYSDLYLKFYQQLLADYVYWEPNYTVLKHKGSIVPTVHDLSHLDCPQYHPKDRVKHLNRVLPDTIAKANHVVVVSEFTKQNLLRHFDVPASQVSIVPPAVATDYYPRSQQDCQRVQDKYKLPDNYVLSVGTLEPRKNTVGLLQAFARLPDALRKQFPLVIVGKRGWLLDELDSMMEPLIEKGEVIRLGYVERADLPMLYSAATVFAYVSFYEGFGMPIAEAMACGTAVISSNSTAMTEVSLGATLEVDPHNNEAISKGLLTLLEDAGQRQTLGKAALQITHQRCWKKSSDQLLNVIAGIAKQGKPA